MQITRLDKFKVPLTGQEIELHQLDYDGGGMRQLRIRIRERARFTTLDIDPLTAQYFAAAVALWAQRQTTDTVSFAPEATPHTPLCLAEPDGISGDV